MTNKSAIRGLTKTSDHHTYKTHIFIPLKIDVRDSDGSNIIELSNIVLSVYKYSLIPE